MPSPYHTGAGELPGRLLEGDTKPGTSRRRVWGKMEASLHDASESGLIEDVRLRLDHGADVDAPGRLRPNYYGWDGGGTLLYLACKAGHADVVLLLLDRGATVDWSADASERTPFFVVCAEGRADIAIRDATPPSWRGCRQCD